MEALIEKGSAEKLQLCCYLLVGDHVSYLYMKTNFGFRCQMPAFNFSLAKWKKSGPFKATLITWYVVITWYASYSEVLAYIGKKEIPCMY